ncbi:MAG: RNAse E [Magnetococcales bacterium]|nr:RNAse E [Magnetococcales bacterium]
MTIDINSGRSTREKDVESTAFKTNLQAVDEIARQLRLRDLGGLVVIDFIDMEDRKHVGEVEKRVKDAFKSDRAKVQIGRISQFGLLELSRQRLRPTFNETNRIECPRCKGLGTIRSVESAAVYTFRCIEEDVAQGKYGVFNYQVSPEVANYLFNHKRASLVRLEETNQVTLGIHADMRLQPPEFNTNHMERSKKDKVRDEKVKVVSPPEEVESVEVKVEPAKVSENRESVTSESSEAGKKKRRRRRRRKKIPGSPEALATPTTEASQGGSETVNGGQNEVPPTPQQDMRHVEALAMRFPGLYTLHDVNSKPTGESSSLSADDDDEDDDQDQELGPHAHDPGLGQSNKGDVAAKRKRPRRGGRGRGRRKPGFVAGAREEGDVGNNIGNSDPLPSRGAVSQETENQEFQDQHVFLNDSPISSDANDSH